MNRQLALVRPRGISAQSTGAVVAVVLAVLATVVAFQWNDSASAAVDPDSFVGPQAPAGAEYRGVTEIHTHMKGQVQADTWKLDQMVLFAPPGEVPVEVGRRWIEWYRQVDVLYQKVSNMENFEGVYRRNDGVNLGPGVKVIGFQESCGAGCGNKARAEVAPGFLKDALANPDNPLEWGHWIAYYEMARGGALEPFFGRATWPTNTILMPHLMAGISFHHFGGDDGLEVGVVGGLMKDLRDWEEMDHEWVEWFKAADKQKLDGAPSSHNLMSAMLYNVLKENDVDTVARIMDEMTAKPEATNAVQAMCDFQDAVMSQTGDQFVERMKGPWGLPDDCPGHRPPSTPTTVAPSTTEAPVTTVAPSTTEAPVTTGAPSTTEAPVTTGAPSTTEAPVTTTTTTGKPVDADLVVRAAGSTGDERLEVRVNDDVVASLELTTAMADHAVDVPEGTSIDDVRVAFVNDAFREGYDRNVTVDRVVFDGVSYETEADTTYVVGSFRDNRCQAGRLKAETLHCNGHFRYGANSVSMDGELTVRARGYTGDERIDVHVGGDVVASIEVSAEPADYTVSVPTDATITDIKLVFANDAVMGDYDRNLFVDYVVHEGTQYQSEDSSTFIDGSFRGGACTSGNLMTEVLHCRGYFAYGQ